MWFSKKRDKCCCEELRKELKRRFDTVDYGMVRLLNLLNEIERKELGRRELSLSRNNPYPPATWRINIPEE